MKDTVIKNTDLLIVGGGLAGMLAAIEAKKNKIKNVTIVEKGKAGRSGAATFAAGVIRVAFPSDDFDTWLKEEVELHQYIVDQKWLEFCDRQIYDIVMELDRWGVLFKKRGGELERVMGRGSASNGVIRNIMFQGGPQLMEVLRKKCQEMQVEIVDRIMITSLLTHDSKGMGALGFDTRSGEVICFKAKATILAAGGTRFKSIFMGHKMDTGDMHAAFYRAGGKLSNYEFAGYNTTCSEFDLAGMNMFVGLGGKFVNTRDEAFMKRYSPIYQDRAELDILASAMAMEIRHGRGPIYLDMTHFNAKEINYLRVTLPIATKILERTGILVGDKIVRKMPWVTHGPDNISIGGGIKIDKSCNTSIKGFFAAGGAATNETFAIVWATVSGRQAGQSAAAYIKDAGEDINIDFSVIENSKNFTLKPLERTEGISHEHILLSFQEAFFPYEVYLIRHEERLRKALKQIEEIRESQLPYLRAYDPHYLRMAHEAQNMVLCSEMLLRSALVRRESRLGHLREDCPETNNIDWLKWTIVDKLEDGAMVVNSENIPIDDYPVKPERKITKHPIFAISGN